jgi:hypothetical protein
LEIVQDEDKSTRKKEDVRHRKVWRRNEKPEEQVNKEQVPEITGFAVVRERKEEQENKEHVQEIVLSGIVVQDQSTEERKKSNFREMMSLHMKRKITLHQRGYFSEPSGLETPSKYEY